MADGGHFISRVEYGAAVEIATFVVGLITVAALPRSLPVGQGDAARLVRSEVARLRDAPTDREWRHVQDLATTIERNASLWIGVPSSKRTEAMLAVRNVLPALKPDPRRLATPNLDPRRIAFLVVECARAVAPADFAEGVTETPEQAEFNVHVLRTLLLRSLEHLQRVALKEWTERNVDDQQPAHAPAGGTSGQLEPAPSNAELEEHLPASDPITDQLAAAVAAELGAVGQDVPVMEDASLFSPSGDLETELKVALAAQLTRPEPDLPTPSFRNEPGERPAPEDGPASLLEAAQNTGAPTVEGEMRPESDVPPTEVKQPQSNGRSGVRVSTKGLIVVIAVLALLAAFLYRDELGVLPASVIDLFASR